MFPNTFWDIPSERTEPQLPYNSLDLLPHLQTDGLDKAR